MTQADPSVVIERLIPMPAPDVFEAWLDPVALERFMCAGPGVRITRIECDPRVGGRFVIVMNVAGQDIVHRGQYVEIERYSRLTFTWLSPYAGEGSRVTVHFAARSTSETKLTLEHVGLAESEKEKHHEGWSYILANLANEQDR